MVDGRPSTRVMLPSQSLKPVSIRHHLLRDLSFNVGTTLMYRFICLPAAPRHGTLSWFTPKDDMPWNKSSFHGVETIRKCAVSVTFGCWHGRRHSLHPAPHTPVRAPRSQRPMS